MSGHHAHVDEDVAGSGARRVLGVFGLGRSRRKPEVAAADPLGRHVGPERDEGADGAQEESSRLHLAFSAEPGRHRLTV